MSRAGSLICSLWPQPRKRRPEQRGTLYGAFLSSRLDAPAYARLVSANAAQQAAANAFLSGTTSSGQAEYHAVVAGPALAAVADTVSQVVSTQSIIDIGGTAEQWLSSSSSAISLIGQVQAKQTSALISQIRSLAQSARHDALASAGLIYLILGSALLATLLVARSILRPLSALRIAALNVAYLRLPDTVRQLQVSEPSEAALVVAPIDVDSTDEIGQVARAFDAVHNEAVQLAGQQAIMRGNVNKMFTNLSRRSQSLVERQLRLIDELEASEQDPDQLANLFRLDHLATRMRRNDENLLVLAGAEGGRRRSEPVPILDVLRAASAEVEHYARVRLETPGGFELAGPAANDVVHLLAELVENATTFSSPSTVVWLRARSLGTSGEMVIEVEDSGIGMTATEIDQANQRLAEPAGMDVSITRLMGLFVVGRLAYRHDITVALRSASAGGLIALVRLPAALISVGVAVLAAPGPIETTDPGTEESPIFDELESEWFTPKAWDPAMTAVAHTSNGATNWSSAGDAGWRAAAALASPELAPDRHTSAGLPVRVPGRHLVPGSAETSRPPVQNGTARHGTVHNGTVHNGTLQNGTVQNGTVPARNPRGLASYQRGVHQARSAEDDQHETAEHEEQEHGG